MTSSVWSNPFSALAAQAAADMTNSYPSVTASSLKILDPDDQRTYLSIQNNSNNGVNLRLEFDSTPASLTTFCLRPGQTWVPEKAPINQIMAIGEKAGVATAFAAGDICVTTGTSPI